MRCPKCQSEVGNAKTCPACGAVIPPGARRKSRQTGDPAQIKDEDLGSPPARIAYRCALYGLIPLAGLVLGPLAFVFGCAALRQELKLGGERVWTAAVLMLLGALILITNWAGVAMMFYGLVAGQG